METRAVLDCLFILYLSSFTVSGVLTDSIKLEDTIKVNNTPDNVTEKTTTTPSPCTVLPNQRHIEETYTGIGSMIYFKLAETLHLQYILCNVLSVYNQWVNHYVTRATSLSKRMQETKSSIEQMLNDLDDIIDRLHEYNTDLHNEKQIKDLLERALVERKNLQVKFESEYNILHCGSLMGKTCKGDNDCRGVGCFLQCKTSGLLWWLRSVCR